MKKYIYIAVLTLIFASCAWREHSVLETMGAAFRQHVKYNDQKNQIKTNIHTITPISYTLIPEEDRKQEGDYYTARVYFAATWSYLVGNRVYNTNDTLNCIYNKDIQFVRVNETGK